MCRPSVFSLVLVALLSAYWVSVAKCSDFNVEDANNLAEADDSFLRMLREMLGIQQGGKRANDFPSVPGFMGARGRRFSPSKRGNDISPPPGFMGARGKKRDMDYADNYLGANRG